MAIASARVLEMPQLPQGAVDNLNRFFGLSLIQYAMLYACQRDDIIKFGCDPHTINWAERVALRQLQVMDRVAFDIHTGKWELTDTGREVLKLVPQFVHVPVTKHGLAEVIPFPESRLTPTDAVNDTVKHS